MQAFSTCILHGTVFSLWSTFTAGTLETTKAPIDDWTFKQESSEQCLPGDLATMSADYNVAPGRKASSVVNL